MRPAKIDKSLEKNFLNKRGYDAKEYYLAPDEDLIGNWVIVKYDSDEFHYLNRSECVFVEKNVK